VPRTRGQLVNCGGSMEQARPVSRNFSGGSGPRSRTIADVARVNRGYAMQRSQRKGSACRLWLRSAGLLAMMLVFDSACGDDVAGTDGQMVADAARGAPDAAAPQPDAGTNAGVAPTLRSQRFASATVQLVDVADEAADGGNIAVAGQVRFRQTSEGVDVEIKLQSCAGGSVYSFALVEAADCAGVSSTTAEWGDGRGQGLPKLPCVGADVAQAATGYSRRSTSKAAWTIGDGSASDPADIVGRVFVVHAENQASPVACGVVTRTEDVQRLELPPDDQAPSLAARAAVGGICLQRQYPGSGPHCPDDAALLRCATTHCDIGNCLQTCQSYASCLDREGMQCTPSCELTAACVMCQNAVQQCASTFCGEHAWCPGTPTPDGPCQRVAHCCALQGAGAKYCIDVVAPLVSSLGGDSNCIGNMMDLGFLPLLPVPCTFGPVEPVASPGADMGGNSAEPAPALADQHAGSACASDADCPGGECAPGPDGAAAGSGISTGFCTRPCEASYECGADGVCSGSPDAKQCFAACREQSDCRDGFVCSGEIQGATLTLPGSCRPKRQVDQLEDGVVGRACAGDGDCSGGYCGTENLLGTSYPGGYCTGRCYEDAECGRGGLCLWTRVSSDPGYCLQGCGSDADCTRDDYGCWELGDGSRVLHACYPRLRPLPDQRAGMACTSDADCGAPHASCAKTLPFYGSFSTNDKRDAPGGYCTQPCALDIECGAGGQCISYGTSGGLCFGSCAADNPCRDGYACYPHGRANDASATVCVVSMPMSMIASP
jgi:hypothetical protein